MTLGNKGSNLQNIAKYFKVHREKPEVSSLIPGTSCEIKVFGRDMEDLGSGMLHALPDEVIVSLFCWISFVSRGLWW